MGETTSDSALERKIRLVMDRERALIECEAERDALRLEAGQAREEARGLRSALEYIRDTNPTCFEGRAAQLRAVTALARAGDGAGLCPHCGRGICVGCPFDTEEK